MRASDSLLLERPSVADPTATPERPSAGPPPLPPSIEQRGKPAWDHLASTQQDALYECRRAHLGAIKPRRLTPIGHSLVKQLAAFEKEPKRHDAGVWYPMDLKRHMQEQGLPVPAGLVYGSAPRQFEQYEPMSFRVKPMTSASQALVAFFEGPTIAECGSVLVALQYAELLLTLGAKKFDTLFGSATQETHELLRMCIHSRGIGEGNPLGYFVRSRELASPGTVGDRPLEVGDQVYIGGVPDYIRKHPAGAGAGWNVLYCGRDEHGRQLFSGFGLKPMTETEIRAVLVEHFNRPRTDEDIAFIVGSRSKTVFDLAAHDVPESVQDREGVTHGFRPRSVRNFDNVTVMRAAFSPVMQTQARMIAHIRDQLGVEIAATVRNLSSGRIP